MDRQFFQPKIVEDVNSESYKKLTSSQVIQALGPLLTENRKARIEEVLNKRTLSVATVVEHLYDTGNISAVMRSAESFGFMPFHVVEKPDAKYKKSERTSKGSEKWLDIQKHTDSIELIQDLKKKGYAVWATCLQGSVPIREVDFSKKIAVIFGNERDGVTPEALNACDGRFQIPMSGFTQSFNISVAAALTFYHIYEYRMKHFGRSGDLSDAEKEELRGIYYQKTLQQSSEKILELTARSNLMNINEDGF